MTDKEMTGEANMDCRSKQAQIVEWANCHDELVEACKLALTAFMPWGTDHPAQEALRAVLAKVEG